MTDPEHPAVTAARMLKSLHEDTMSHIRVGYRHFKTDENGVEHDVTEQVIEECRKQDAMCDKVIEAGRLRQMGQSDEAEAILRDIRKITGEVRKAAEQPGSDAAISVPDIGDYGHDRPENQPEKQEDYTDDGVYSSASTKH